MLSGKAVDVGFVAVDIRDLNSVRYAFKESWPEGAATGKGVTVIHTAANLRFYERHEAFIRRSAMVNVEGTRNLLTASRETGADIFIFTSSASIKIQPIHFWKLPFRRSTGNFVQTLNDSSPTPGRHEECWSNYGYTKILAENLVREADDPGKGFRTGCLQPGSVIFGPGGDFITSGFLKKGISTYWVKNMIQSFVYVENVSYAHLLYEARLLEALGSPAEAPVQKLGGDTFMIAGAGNPVSHGDILLAMASLTDGSSRPPLIPTPPAVVLHLISYLIEFYHMVQFCLSGLLPPLTGDIIKVQPSMFHSSLVHFKTDDSRARLPSSEGGLGYSPPWTTLDGIWQAVYEHLKDQAEDKAIAAGKL
ncbi:hypothetical protein NLJ89_g1632 [Agrocybe chaxingu]|uniref:3-beta hydroxysteroid dehydrogenase/isomerase domain-containing protein n=1 Tax=Agrocybe chaxingu TaxID=84603 RepID=A0A9W8MZN8_9AGAR|nr:hypothetical protein NLJ89_g1632 [Agrocybe chaxingu]